MTEENKINAAIKNVKQSMFGGNFDGIKFGGNNISMEPNHIVLIKGGDTQSEWSDQGSRNDAEQIVSQIQKRK